MTTVPTNELETTCPRCGGTIENDGIRTFPAYSRATEERDIEICGPCGSDEVFNTRPIAEWPLNDISEAIEVVRATPEIAEAVQEVLAYLRDETVANRCHITGGALMVDSSDEIVKLRSEVRGDIVFDESVHTFGRFYTFDGQQLLGKRMQGVDVAVQWTPNNVQLFDDGIFVSEGIYIAAGPAALDGEPAVRLLKYKVWQARKMQEDRDKVLAEHPEILDLRPEWATELTASNPDEPEVSFSAEVGGVTYSRWFCRVDGAWEASDSVGYIPVREELTLEQMRRCAADILALVDAVERTMPQVKRPAGVDEQLRALDD